MDLPNVTLLTGRKVTRLETDPPGKTVTEVVCQTEQGEERWTGDIVVLAAGAANTAAVLLASANAAHPERPGQRLRPGGAQLHVPHPDGDGLADRRATWTSPSPRRWPCNDFYWGDPDGGYDLPMGHIQLLEYMSGQTLEGQVSDWLPPGLVPDAISGAASPSGCCRCW